MSSWKPTGFDALPGWTTDDHEAAFSCFRLSALALVNAVSSVRPGITPSEDLLKVAEMAVALDSGRMGKSRSRSFFEENFQPHQIPGSTGFVTGYYEPELEASTVRTEQFPVPVYRRPEDLVEVGDQMDASRLPEGFEFGRKTQDGYVEYHDRAEIGSGALENRGLEIFWLKSAIDAFFMHIQGSARLALENGTTTRITYAGKSGHPYTAIGKLLVDRGELSLEDADMQGIRNWLEAHPEQGHSLMNENRSYIFFEEVADFKPHLGPVAAAGVPLTPGRSIAIDKEIHPYGSPIWISTNDPLPHMNKTHDRLMIAQDTGSAIIGKQRGDLFIGSGMEAGKIAGKIRHGAGFYPLFPKPLGKT